MSIICQIYFIIKDFDWRLIDHALKRLPILLPNSNLLSMKGNTKERVGWQLLQYCCEVRLAPNHALYVTSIIIILILHLSVRDVRDVRESGRSREAIRPELKTFVSLHSWTWTLHEAAH